MTLHVYIYIEREIDIHINLALDFQAILRDNTGKQEHHGASTGAIVAQCCPYYCCATYIPVIVKRIPVCYTGSLEVSGRGSHRPKIFESSSITDCPLNHD